MLEKINSCLSGLSDLCEEYKKQKPLFRQKNCDAIIGLKKNTAILEEIRRIIKSYDDAGFWGKLWIGLRYRIGYYKELIQYYELNDLLQQAISSSAEERVFFIDSIITILEKFSFDGVKDIISKIYKKLVSIKTELNADSESNIFSVVSVVGSSDSKPVITVSSDKSPENLQEVKHHNMKIVRNMIDLLNEMREVDWKKLSDQSEYDAKQKYDEFMRKFEMALKAYSHLRILTHPDHHGSNESSDLFRELQETYNKFKAHKENIKKYVNIHGLASLNEHIPKEEQSINDLLKALNVALQTLIDNYDKYSKIFEELLPSQNEDLKVLAEEIEDQSKAVGVLKKESVRQDGDIENLKKDLGSQSTELKKLREASNLQSERLKELSGRSSDFKDEVQRAMDEKLRTLMEKASQAESGNDQPPMGRAFFEKGRTVVCKDTDKKSDGTNTDKKEFTLS